MADGCNVYGRCFVAFYSPSSDHLFVWDDMEVTYKQATPDAATLARRIKRGVYAYFDKELHKRCIACKEYWPADTEFFYNSNAHRDGIGDTCRACSCEQRQYYRANPQSNQVITSC